MEIERRKNLPTDAIDTVLCGIKGQFGLGWGKGSDAKAICILLEELSLRLCEIIAETQGL